ncbi:MAG: MoaD/ThiS family protein [Desulfurococcaceae archaeon]
MIKVRVRFSGLFADIAGKESEEISVPNGTCLNNFIKIVLANNRSLGEWYDKVPYIQIFLNGVEATGREAQSCLNEGDEVTLSPPLHEGG